MRKRSSVNLLVTCIITLSVTFSFTVFSQESSDNAVVSTDFPVTDLMPIADLHFHPGSDVAHSPADIIKLMNDTGVKWAGSGSISGRGDSSRLWEEYAQKMGNRLIPFAGQRELNRVYFQGGVGSMEDPEMLEDFIQEVEYDLESGNVKGIGEIFINNMHSNKNPEFRRKADADADADTFTVLYQLISQYDAFLTFHMEGDSDSLEQMENLLSSDRNGRILWNHCGTNISASTMRGMMRRNSNLYCEFSFRYLHEMSSRNIFSASGIDSGWRELIEDFPDRFMVGTDAHSASDYREYIEVVRSGLLANLSDETAEKVAYKNAQRLFNLK